MFIFILIAFFSFTYVAREWMQEGKPRDASFGWVIYVGFVVLYFTFEGIRGSFSYHKLIKNNPNRSMSCDANITKDLSIKNNGEKMDLNNAEKKIRNAWIASLILIVYFLYLMAGMLALINKEGIAKVMIVVLIITIISFGLTFGIYKKNKICTISMFVCVIFFVAIEVLIQSQHLEDLRLFMAVSCGMLYYIFEGIRGTFTYHKLKK